MTRKYYIIGATLIAAVLVSTVIAYPYLPERVPMHWDAHGNVNGWGEKWTLFAIDPGIMAGMLLLFAALPWLSPKQFTVDSFRSTYLYIMVMVLAMMTYIHVLVLAAGLQWSIDVSRAVMGGVSLLIALTGNVLGKVRRNFYVGIRTPWTIASEHVWNATHRLGARTFFVGGLIGLVAVILHASFWLPLVCIVAAGLTPVVYSLVFYKQFGAKRGTVGV